VSEFTAILDDSADLACMQSKGYAKTQLRERARAILQQRGTHLLASYIATIDRAAYERYLPARIGRDGVVKTGDLARYQDMIREVQKPLDDAVDLEKLKSYSPGALLDGIEGDLAELCISGADPQRPRP
jgi:hypothetical protein